MPSIERISSQRISSDRSLSRERLSHAILFLARAARALEFRAMIAGAVLLFLASLTTRAQAPAQAPPVPASRSAVVLDAAHGGEEAGARLITSDGNTEPEKAYTLELSVRLRSLLAARGISVVDHARIG